MRLELGARASLSIPQAARFTGLSVRAVARHLRTGDFDWFWEGARKRVITASILAYQRRRSGEDMK